MFVSPMLHTPQPRLRHAVDRFQNPRDEFWRFCPVGRPLVRRWAPTPPSRRFLRVARHSLGAAEWHFGRVGKSLPTQGLEIVNRIAVSFRSDGVRERRLGENLSAANSLYIAEHCDRASDVFQRMTAQRSCDSPHPLIRELKDLGNRVQTDHRPHPCSARVPRREEYQNER